MARMKNDTIDVVGADANNLRDLNISFPVAEVSMVVGVSGSGKTSLLLHTLAREGGKRLRSFLGVNQDHLAPPMSRAFVGRMPPTLHIGQRAFRASSRTTVGTSSSLLPLLRRMFIKWSNPVSEHSGAPVPPPGIGIYAAWLLQHQQGPLDIWAIPISFEASDGIAMAERLRALGFSSVIVRSETDSTKQWEKGRVLKLDRFKPLAVRTRHIVETHVGSVELGTGETTALQLEQLLALAFEAGEGRVLVDSPQGILLDSRYHWVTPADPCRYRPASEHLLSFNAPDHEDTGACPTCRGLGESTILNLDALVAHPDRSLHQGALSLWTEKNYKYVNIQHETIEGLRDLNGFDPDLPWSKLDAKARRLIIEGAGEALIADRDLSNGRTTSTPRRFDGFQSAIIERVNKRGTTAERLAYLVNNGSCPNCLGSRWSVQALALRLGGYSIGHLLALPFEALSSLCSPGSDFSRALPDQAAPYLKQLHRLARSFVGAGLGHLSGDRGMLEISEGESRRLRLAAALDGHHSGLCLLLDEPARGLHDEDVDRLAATLAELRGTHSLIINDHRRRLAAAASFFVEIGPGAGPEGGRVTYSGKVPEHWWSEDPRLQRSAVPVQVQTPRLLLKDVHIHNVSGVDVAVPLGHLISVVGVSGSGKSSFVLGALVPALAVAFHTAQDALEVDVRRGRWASLSGTEHLSGFVALGQRTPTPNRRSTVATFLGLAEQLRNHFAKLPGAAAAGLQASDFGLNAGQGRCDRCLGIGEIEEAGHWVVCPSCAGSRFGTTVLTILDEGYDIAQILDRSITSLRCAPFPAFDQQLSLLDTLDEMGIGHLSLGRRLDTLSGGELQRLRIARELSKHASQRLMFILDEPAAGLHRDDVTRLLGTLDRMVKQGHTVLLVEHNLELVAATDWIIEFGPGCGPLGGQLIAQGPPSHVREQDTPSGRMLREASKPRENAGQLERYQHHRPSSLPEASSAARWLKRLLGHDLPPLEQELEHEGGQPAVVLDAHNLRDLRLLEFGGLDHELALLMLEGGNAQQADITTLVDVWETAADAELTICPLLQAIHTWGAHVPASVVRDLRRQLKVQGLRWTEHEVASRIRAFDGPLACDAASDRSARTRAVKLALLLGGGYIELVRGQEVIATCNERATDLDRYLIGPRVVSASDFDRHTVRGQCPCCLGRGQVVSYDPRLLINDEKKAVEQSGFLQPEALDVLKGVHRNALVPFFKRLVKEERWPAERPIERLSTQEYNVLLHGFWVPSGAGAFLRTPTSNPKEVASWLRWDGLFAHVRDNLSRGSRPWRDKVLASQRMVRCPLCVGSGLRQHVLLFELGSRSYADWVKTGTVAELCQALKHLASPNARSARRQSRLVEALAPLDNEHFGATRLCDLAADSPYTLFGPAVAQAFTTMPVLTQEDL
ncbi:ATP-binding cassette domain-containing protein [Pseudomonas sp. NyZ480]|uniref:ATP-binding cassette domain-containing protein n=1 Tax=Pseudomonas sp. NyZ480 TaxID=3035289 RepID=UPI00240A4A86|nr:ATP-binding cassette domain-containing protein [Pseudomonas sp. NyZ480]WEZ86637.1 ATP-binding cassette domain-containing protein [Pseudomonas sp. NyZ480]